MKMRIWLVVGIVLSVAAFSAIYVFTTGYRVSKDDSYIPHTGAVDLYTASREELTGQDLCQYSGTFGEVKDAKAASKIAAQVIKEVYDNDEYPYIVKYNQNANAWIVHGSLPLFQVGGVASVAIDPETGEILMLMHTK